MLVSQLDLLDHQFDIQRLLIEAQFSFCATTANYMYDTDE